MSDKFPIDLHQLILEKIAELGDEGATVFFERTPNELRKWTSLTRMPDVQAAQKMLQECIKKKMLLLPEDAQTEAPPQGITIPPRDEPQSPPNQQRKTAVEDTPIQAKAVTEEQLLKEADVSSKYAIICATERDMAPLVVQSTFSMWKKTLPEEIAKRIGKMYISWDSCIHRSRNELAKMFLESSAEWAIHIDADMVIPNGNPVWFKKYVATRIKDKWLQIDALQRLTSHNKTFVSAVYAERSFNGKLICGPGMSPRGQEDEELVKGLKANGPRDEVVPVPYVGFGCVAVHRRVFEDILKTQPEIAGKEGQPPDFFTAFENGPRGEDTAFCARAIKAGHNPFLDLAVFAAHIGRHAYSVM